MVVFILTTVQKASAHIFAPHLAEGKGLVTGFTFPFETNQHGIITTVNFYQHTLVFYESS